VFVRLLSALKRALDFLFALALLLLLSPIFLVACILLWARGAVLERTPKLGRWCEPFQELSFATRGYAVGTVLQRLRLAGLPRLFNILRGDMSFIGPRAAAPEELSPRERAVRKRYDVRPGLICLWWIRRRTNIAYDTELAADAEYVDTQSVWGDIGIALRAIPAVLYGEGVATAPDLVTILGIPINNMTMSEAVQQIIRRVVAPPALDDSAPAHVCFVNADCANIACRDQEYFAILQNAAFTFADGIGVKLAGKLLGQAIKQNVNGTDMFPRLCEALSGTGKGMFLLGARPGVAEAVRRWVNEHHPQADVRGCHHGYFTPDEEEAVIKQIADSGAQMLIVAMGVPRQEKWINQHLGKTGARVGIGVGGLFDFYSGRIPRAPMWMREIGLEWLYRFWQEPGRMWKRYFVGNAVFLFRVVRERFRRRSALPARQ
jgi:N-acetylglucosaminyldiphosphoundecaprenol N-acetyl-beta-D-mannosaminyltransferase